MISLQEATSEYVNYLRTEGLAPQALKKYEGVFTIWNEFLSNNTVRFLDRITLRNFDQFRAQRKEQGRKLKTLYTEGVILKQFLKWAKSRGLFRNDPLVEAKLEKPIFEPKAGPTLEQIHLILTNADANLSPSLAVLTFTGIRSGELQRLRKEDLDLEGNCLHVVSRPDAPTKTKRCRKIPLHTKLRAVLGRTANPTGALAVHFSCRRKYPEGDHHINPKHLNERFGKLVEKLGLPAGRDGGFTVHSLRHSFETIAVNAGIPQRVVDTWLGHHSDRSMAAVYYKLSDEEWQKFMQQVPFECPTWQPCGKGDEGGNGNAEVASMEN